MLRVYPVERERTVMRKALALCAIVSIGFVSPAVASARHGFHGYRSVTWGGPWGSNYRWHGPVWLDLTGVGGYGYGYPYGYAPYYDGGCFFMRQRFWPRETSLPIPCDIHQPRG